MNQILRNIRNRLFSGLARREDLERVYDQIAGLMQIYTAIRGDAVIKSLRGWAISPDAMGVILCDLQERISPVVVEFGCGQSTVILASYLKHRGGGRLISVESDKEYASGIQKQLKACGVEDIVEFHIYDLVKSQPLAELPPCRSYPVDKLPNLAIDLALIDGPPMTNTDIARFVPLKWALDHINKEGAVYLDDSARSGEKQILSLLLKNDPRILRLDYRAEKGLTRLTLV